MPAKKKTRQKSAQAKVIARNRKTPVKKKAPKGKPPAKKLAKKKVARKAKPAVSKPVAKKAATRKPAKKVTKKPTKKPAKPSRGKQAVTFHLDSPEVRSGRQSGDLQGLSGLAGADSESVNELAEEGNSFEAAAVKGVEDAGDGRSVRTHEVLEDDVPEEYLDQD